MTPAELCAWNTSKLSELGGDALEVATAVVFRWPTVKITSAARDYKDQARAMAQNAVARRDNPKTHADDRLKWIADTYWPSVCALALQKWFELHPHALVSEVVSGFQHIMRGMQPRELRALSKHIVIRERDEGDGTGGLCIDDRACAVDFAPPSQSATREELAIDENLCAFLMQEARARGGKFLENEGGLTRRHWQSK